MNFRNILLVCRAGKHTDSAIRNAVSNVQQEDPFKSLGVRVKDMEPAMAWPVWPGRTNWNR